VNPVKKLVVSSVVLIALLVATVVSASLVLADEPAVSGAQENHSGCAHGQGNMWTIKIEAASKVLGMTVEAIQAELQAGKSLPTIAAEQGVDVQALRDAVHGAVRAAGGCSCGSHE
jgi:hypothetical protein